MISLLARNDVDQAIEQIKDAEPGSHIDKSSKDYTVTRVNQMFAFCKCFLLKADHINFVKVEEKL